MIKLSQDEEGKLYYNSSFLATTLYPKPDPLKQISKIKKNSRSSWRRKQGNQDFRIPILIPITLLYIGQGSNMCDKDTAFWEMKEIAPTLGLPGHPLLLTLLPLHNPHIPSKVSLYLVSLLPSIPTNGKKKKKKTNFFWEIVVRKYFRKKSFFLEIFLYRSIYLTMLSKYDF